MLVPLALALLLFVAVVVVADTVEGRRGRTRRRWSATDLERFGSPGL